MNPNRYIKNETSKWTSLVRKLRREGVIDEEFEIKINNLSLEELIGIKLELSGRTLKSPMYGFQIWSNLTEIVRDAVLKYAIGITQTTAECAKFLGITQVKLLYLTKKFQIWNYFDERQYSRFDSRKRIKTVDLTSKETSDK